MPTDVIEKAIPSKRFKLTESQRKCACGDKHSEPSMVVLFGASGVTDWINWKIVLEEGSSKEGAEVVFADIEQLLKIEDDEYSPTDESVVRAIELTDRIYSAKKHSWPRPHVCVSHDNGICMYWINEQKTVRVLVPGSLDFPKLLRISGVDRDDSYTGPFSTAIIRSGLNWLVS